MPKCPPLDSRDLPDWPAKGPAGPPAEGVVQVWLWSITSDNPSVACLSPDEVERAGRFHFERDRRHFINARAGLRRLLAGALGADPRDIAFRYQGLGKPSLADSGGDLRFNLSHSGGVALCAISRGVDLGADVEALRTPNHPEGIAERCFSTGELTELHALPGDRKHAGFFRLWTNKEAVVKLLGSGLGFPLPSFTTPLNPTEGAVVTLPADNALGLGDCWVQALPAGEKLQASLAVSRRPERVECFSLPF